jgi:hypothetical protein
MMRARARWPIEAKGGAPARAADDGRYDVRRTRQASIAATASSSVIFRAMNLS